MLEQLAIARSIVTDGHENVPAWRIETPGGAWLILTRFDRTNRRQSDWASTSAVLGLDVAPESGTRVIHTWQEVY